jgi:uncharacterized protein DUF6578
VGRADAAPLHRTNFNRFDRPHHIEVFVDSWEIECCAPTPTVGEPTSWVLTFLGPSATWRELDRDRAWRAERREGVTWLTDGPVTARWYERNGPPPEPGPTMVRGSLIGTVHEEGPRVTGTIQRIRFATANYRLVEPRRLEPVPGTLALTDVAEAPRSLFFTFDSEGRPNAQGADQPKSVGVLLDMTVP